MKFMTHNDINLLHDSNINFSYISSSTVSKVMKMSSFQICIFMSDHSIFWGLSVAVRYSDWA